MGNWNNPTVASNYTNFVTELRARDIDVATAFASGTETNIPTSSVRFNRGLGIFQEWNGVAWGDLVIGVTGGGTGGNTAAAARIALGLGTMATQNNNAVLITGGSISGVTMDASVLTSGVVALNRGGTGASLALGAAGTFLQSNGAAIIFGTNGAALTGLNASQITAGVLPESVIPLTLVNNYTFGGAITISSATSIRTFDLFVLGGAAHIDIVDAVNINTTNITFTNTLSGPSATILNVSIPGTSVLGTLVVNTATTLAGSLALNLPGAGGATNGTLPVLQPAVYLDVTVAGNPFKIALYQP